MIVSLSLIIVPSSPFQPVSRLYHAVRYLKTWPDAQRYCRTRFTDLATVDSVGDVYSVMNQVDLIYTGLLWIGLQSAANTQWCWSTGDEALANYFNWAINKPSGNFKCVSNMNGWWSDTDCQTLLYFVCYSGESANAPKFCLYKIFLILLVYFFSFILHCSLAFKLEMLQRSFLKPHLKRCPDDKRLASIYKNPSVAVAPPSSWTHWDCGN